MIRLIPYDGFGLTSTTNHLQRRCMCLALNNPQKLCHRNKEAKPNLGFFLDIYTTSDNAGFDKKVFWMSETMHKSIQMGSHTEKSWAC